MRNVLLLAGLMISAASALAEGPDALKPAAPTDNVILDASGFWRVRTVWETQELVLPDGQVKHARVDGKGVWAYFQKEGTDKIEAPESAYKIVPAEMVRLPADTPNDWMKPEFDDGSWVRLRAPILKDSYNENWKLILVRGQFEVTDLDQAGDLTLSLAFRGGAMVYLNGQELTRVSMAKGDLDVHAPSDTYGIQAYCDAGGFLLSRRPNPDTKPLLDKRIRSLERFRIPREKMRKGVNVLAVSIHRAPTPFNYYLRHCKGSYASHEDTRWACLGLLGIRLLAQPGAAVQANTQMVKGRGFKIWNQSVIQSVFLPDYPDPFSQLNPITLTGVRNGTFAGQVVIGDDDIITGLKATVSDLAGPAGATIPASAIRVRYALPDGPPEAREGRFFDSLEDNPPEEVPVYKEHGGALQPIWITVTVPADAKPGDYSGSVTITSDNNKDKPAAVPVKLQVIDWKLPPVADYSACFDIIQSPESVAMAYDVDFWSDKHMKLLDRTFALLAPLGVKTLYITAIRRTHFGNEHALVRWVRDDEGELKPEFSLVEKYLDVATKHLGKVPCIILYSWEPPESQGHAGGAGGEGRTYDKPILITKFDPATGKQTAGPGPSWGTPEAKAFWKKLTDGIKPVLAKRGLEDSLLFGLVGDARPTKQAMDDITAGMDGKDRWAIHSHLYCDKWQGHPMGMINALWGIGCEPADPSAGYSFGWSNPLRLNYYPREMKIQSTLVEHRVKLENWMGARRSYTPFIAKGMGPRGLGRIGGDFWNVVKDDKGRPVASLAGRYPEAAWGQLNLNFCISYVLGRGAKGALATQRSEAFRESIQEVEARIYLEKVWLDDEAKTALGEEMVNRIRSVLDERIRVCLNSSSEGQPWYISSGWRARSALLFGLAAEVSKKLGREPNPNLKMETPKKN